MPTEFSALPVNRGDAFLLRAGNECYLFDGGIQQPQAAQQLIGAGVTRLKAAICSHNDADHANGIIGVLRSAIHVDEVWIPGRWAQFLGSASSIQSVERPWWQALTDEILERFCAAAGLHEIIQGYRENEAGDQVELDGKSVGGIQSIADALQMLAPRLPGHLTLAVATAGLTVPQVGTVSAALQAGLRIIDIAQLAINRNCRLRLFEFKDALINEDVQGTNFVSVNSKEVKRLRVVGNVVDLLCLTIVNRESLVFHHINQNDDPILFCADSDLSFLHGAHFPVPQFTLATAPHHGSNDNRRLYARVSGKDFTWVRSDASATGPRPCPAYLRQTTRYCTICRRSNRLKQQVDLVWRAGQWIAAPNIHACSCH
jgi:hypothetical protein